MLKIRPVIRITLVALTALLLAGCYQPAARYEPWQAPKTEPTPTPTHAVEMISTPVAVTPLPEGQVDASPTPDPVRILPTQRSEKVEYYVKSGDTLAKIALAYQVSVLQIIQENQIANPDLIEVGQLLIIPPASVNARGTDFKIIPDAELVYSPSASAFNVYDAVQNGGGYLVGYTDVIDEEIFNGAEVVQRVADENSINPRLILAMLEYQSGWVTNPSPDEKSLLYPMGYYDFWRQGLYKQLSWVCNELNRGFYLWQINALAVWTLADGTVVAIDPTINGGTAGLQYFFGILNGKQGWDQVVSEGGFIQTYQKLFGNPFNYAYEPLIPDGLVQPELILPLPAGETWSFTGGPHGGWNDGSAWAALDFAPPGKPMGCMRSIYAATSASEGMVVRAGNGAVVVDLDGDGIEQTGWTIHYLHIDAIGRVEVGTQLEYGDIIGYPSCEGGFSTATHLHIARRYNGVWIAADGDVPFEMEGWVAVSAGIEYDGYLVKDERSIEAWNGQFAINQIGR